MKTQQEIIAALRRQVQRAESLGRVAAEAVLSTGWERFDELLPERGLCRGTLVEWIGSGPGACAGTLALLVARRACADGGTLVVIDRPGRFFSPAAVALGIDPQQLVIVRPTSDQDEVWAYDQSLRCEAVSAVWGYTEHLPGRAFRRLQLSAEAGRSLALLVRPHTALQQPSWSHLRLLVEPLLDTGDAARFRLEVLRCLGGPLGGVAEIELAEALAGSERR